MISFFQKRTVPVLGIDISSTAVKLIELGRAGTLYRVETYAIEPLPDGAVKDKKIEDVEQVANCIRKAVKRARTKLKHAAVAVPSAEVITKTIQMSAALKDKDSEMEAQIKVEVDQYIPYPLEEMNLDFCVLGFNDRDPGMVDVLLAASRAENVEQRMAAINMAGLTAKIVDVETYAVGSVMELMAQVMPNQGEGLTVALIDMGATMTTLTVLHDLRIIYNREQPFGGKQLTEEIMHRYGISLEEAEIAKRQEVSENYTLDAIHDFRETAVQQIQRSLQFFFSSSQFSTVDFLLLGGGCSSIPGLDEAIELRVGTKVLSANPFSKAILNPRINESAFRRESPALLVACGLALRSFDHEYSH